MSTHAKQITLRPHAHELERAVVSDHVAVFGDREGHQFEVSGETGHEDVEIDRTNVELDADDVAQILDGGTYTEQCEDPAGRTYTLHVRGGERHPKGTPVHTREADR